METTRIRKSWWDGPQPVVMLFAVLIVLALALAGGASAGFSDGGDGPAGCLPAQVSDGCLP